MKISFKWLNMVAVSTGKLFSPEFPFSLTYKLKRSIKFITNSIKTVPEINDCIYYHDSANTIDFPPRTISLFFALFIDHKQQESLPLTPQTALIDHCAVTRPLLWVSIIIPGCGGASHLSVIKASYWRQYTHYTELLRQAAVSLQSWLKSHLWFSCTNSSILYHTLGTFVGKNMGHFRSNHLPQTTVTDTMHWIAPDSNS